MNVLQELRSLVRLYAQQFKTTFASMLQYRASLFIWMISSVLEPLIYLIVWSTVSNGSGGSVGGYTAGGFAAYYIAFMLVNQVTYTWIMWEYEYRVRQGSLSFALLKPVHPIHSDISDNLSSKLITLPILLVIGGVLTLIFKPVATFSWWAGLAFLPAILLAFLTLYLRLSRATFSIADKFDRISAQSYVVLGVVVLMIGYSGQTISRFVTLLIVCLMFSIMKSYASRD